MHKWKPGKIHKSGKAKLGEAKLGEAKLDEAKLGEAKPDEVKLGEAKPVQLEPKGSIELGTEHEPESIAQSNKALGADDDTVQVTMPNGRPRRQSAFRAPTSGNARSPDGRWKVLKMAANSYQLRNGNDIVHVRDDRITGSTGSADEVQKMFEVGAARHWNPMAFSGNATFKRDVMKAALENDFAVQTHCKEDSDLFKQVEREHKEKMRGRDGDDAEKKQQVAPSGKNADAILDHAEYNKQNKSVAPQSQNNDNQKSNSVSKVRSDARTQ